MKFLNRTQAGEALADELLRQGLVETKQQAVVCALPRGGVPVASVVAQKLDLPLEVLVVRKLGLPGNPEYGVGAIAEAGVKIIADQRLAKVGFSTADLRETLQQETAELERRVKRYRTAPLPSLTGKIIFLVDDGVATGVTMQAALKYFRLKHQPKQIIVAVPVSATDVAQKLRAEGVKLVCLHEARNFFGVGQFYQHFKQVSDGEVKRLLEA